MILAPLAADLVTHLRDREGRGIEEIKQAILDAAARLTA